MSDLFRFMGLGAGALATASFRARVHSENIAGADRPGYARRDISTTVGLGVNREAMLRVPRPVGLASAVALDTWPRFLSTLSRRQSSTASRAQAQADRLSAIEAAIPGIGDASLQAAVTNFFDGVRSMGVAPTDAAARSAVVSRADALAEMVRGISSRLVADSRDVQMDIDDTVAQVNAFAQQLGTLEIQITRSRTVGADPADLLTEQREVLDDLAKLIDVNTFEQSDGSLLILTAGNRVLVARGDVQPLTSAPLDATRGKLAGLISYRDTDLPGAAARIDQFAYDFSNAMNAIHVAGYGLDGLSGRPLFEPIGAVAGAASGMQVDAAIAADPSRIAAAAAPGLPLDNRNALLLADVELANLASGLRPGAAAFAVSSGLGIAGAAAQGQATASSMLAASLRSRLSDAAGVDPDQEALHLLEAQKAFEAAARVVTAADEMLDVLLRIGS